MGRLNKVRWRADRKAWVSKVGGKLVILGRDPADKKGATRELHRRLVEAGSATGGGPGIELEAVADLFLDFLGRERRPLTVEWYVRHLKTFVKAAGPATLAADVRPHHVTAWLATKPGWGPTTRHGAITAVKGLFAWAKREGFLEANRLVDVAKPTSRARQADLTREQADAILALIPDRGFHDLLSTLRETGMRPSEAMTLGAGQVDFEASTASVVGKGRARTVYLTPWVLGLFRELAAKWPEGPILRNRLGHPWTRHATSGRFRALRALEGSPAPEGVSAESFRHAFATDALEAGVPIATVAELMGHRSTRMVERHYSKLGQRTAHLHEALGKVRPGGVSPATGSGPASRPDDPGP